MYSYFPFKLICYTLNHTIISFPKTLWLASLAMDNSEITGFRIANLLMKSEISI